jgi:hypothetical protein
MARYAKAFPKISTFTVDEIFGGWTQAQKEHFDDGGVYDRRRARALATDAERYLTLAIADGQAQPFLRKLPALAREEQARIASWRAAHP